MRVLILPLIFVTAALASVPIREGCSADSTLVATMHDTDPIQVHHGVVGEASPCYAVSATQAGIEVRGYILDSTLPVIQEFEKKRALESRMIATASPAPEPGEKKGSAPRPTGPPFESWSGMTTSGRRMQIAPGIAKVTLVTFWSAHSGTASRFVEHLKATEGEFRGQGLKSFGFVEGVDKGRANFYLDDMGLDAPQALDSQRLGAKYNVDAAKGTTLVLDESNHIVASSSNLSEIRAAVVSLLSSQ